MNTNLLDVPGKADSLVSRKGSRVSSRSKRDSFARFVNGMDKYDPYRIPPLWNLAEDHLKCKTIGPEKIHRINSEKVLERNEFVNICDCCGRIVDREQLKLSCRIEELAFLGPGYPLFFYFIRYCILILASMLLTSGIYNIISNSLADDCVPEGSTSSSTDVCARNFITNMTIANKRNHEDLEAIQSWLSILTILVIVCIFQHFRFIQRKISIECDILDIAPNDYGIRVRNIPKVEDLDYKDHLKKHIDNLGYKVQKVVLCFELEQLFEIHQQKAQLIQEKKKIISEIREGKLPEDSEELILNAKMFEDLDCRKLELEKLFYRGKADSSPYFSGVAIVLFEKEHMKEDIIAKWECSYNKKRKLLLGAKKGYKKYEELDFHGQMLIIEQAPDPNDLIWENQGFPYKTHMIRGVLSDILSFILLLLAAFSIYLLSSEQQKTKTKSSGTEKKSLQTTLKMQIIGTGISVLIFIINFVLEWLFTKFAEYEKHNSRTAFNISLAKKLSIAQFANTALITFFVTYIQIKNYYGPGGLLYNQFIVFLVNLAVPNLMSILMIPYFIQNFMRKRHLKKGEESNLTQDEAQK